MKPFVLWDLDGTLTDPQEGITRCIQYALERTGRKAPAQTELLWCIGPPLAKSFARLVPGATETQITELISKYRERFSTTGQFENAVYEPVIRVVAGLREKTHFVATSKPHVFATTIASHFGFDSHFKKIYGSELAGERTDKVELIAHILETEKIRPTEAVMIGDREHDVIGARKNGLISIGVTWGYGSRRELEMAGADLVFDAASNLAEFLKRG